MKKINNIIVIVHVFYVDLAFDIFERLNTYESISKIYITTIEENIDDLKIILKKYPFVYEIYVFENKGRDVAPLIQLLKLIELKDDDIVLKVHTKKSLHLSIDESNEWRRSLYDILMPKGKFDLIINKFKKNIEIGMIGPSAQLMKVSESFYAKETINEWNNLINKLPQVEIKKDLEFFAGTMFWAKGIVFNQLSLLRLQLNDFESEKGQTDGTIAHAIERIFPLLAQLKGLETVGLNIDNHYSWFSKRTIKSKDFKKILDVVNDGEKIKFLIIIRAEKEASFQEEENTKNSINKIKNFYDSIDYKIIEGINSKTSFDALKREVKTNDYEYLIFIDAGEILNLDAFFIMLQHIKKENSIDAIFCDEVLDNGYDYYTPILYPEFNVELLKANPAIYCRHFIFNLKRIDFNEISPNIQYENFELELLFYIMESRKDIYIKHIAEPLIKSNEECFGLYKNNAQISIYNHLQRMGYDKAVVEVDEIGNYNTKLNLLKYIRISVIINCSGSIDNLVDCLKSIRKHENIEIEVIILSGNLKKLMEVIAIENFNFSIRYYDFPVQIYTEELNLLISELNFEYFLIINENTLFYDFNFFENLTNKIMQPEAAAIAPLIHNGDSIIIESGYVFGMKGSVSSLYQGDHISNLGYLNRYILPQNIFVSSLYGMLIKKSAFIKIGGFNKNLLNREMIDIEVCINFIESGYSIILNPNARLLKFDNNFNIYSKSLPEKNEKENSASSFYISKIKKYPQDPTYNQNFSLIDSGFKIETNIDLNFQPMILKNKITIVGLPADKQGCGQYRIIKPLNYLRDYDRVNGIISYRHLLPIEISRLKPDVIIFQRQLEDHQLISLAETKKFSNCFSIYDLDDLLINLPVTVKNPWKNEVKPRLRKALSTVDRLVVSTEALYDEMFKWHTDIKIQPLYLPLDWWGNLDIIRDKNSKPRVGWAGGLSHHFDLELLKDVVINLTDKVDWIFFGYCPPSFKPYIKEFHAPVTIDNYASKLASLKLDIAIAPLVDNEFNRCKSMLKLLEYGACSYPVISSNVTPYRESGLPITLVKNKYKNWLDAINYHIADLEGARKIGSQLREKILKHWMLDENKLDKLIDNWIHSR